MKKSILLLTSLLLASPGWASSVTFSGTAKTVPGTKVELYPQASIQVGDKLVTLNLSGAGVRKKSVLGFSVSVYAAASYVQDVPALRSAKILLDGVKVQKARVLKLTMLRGMSAADVVAAFNEALSANEITAENRDRFATLLSGWKGNMPTGATITIVGFEQGKIEKLSIEVPNNTLQTEGDAAAFDFWKIWFGEGDSGIKALQPLLVGKD